MREIKFRAFDKDSSTMYMQNDLIINFDEIGEDVYIHKDDYVIPMFAYELTQYTGLKDINGTEIYEGDLLVDTNDLEEIGKVIFDEGCFQVQWDGIVEDLFENCNVCEVIGNIYEDLESLDKHPHSFTGANINEIQMSESARIDIKEVKDIENSKRKEYGKYKGYYKWDLAKAWFNMPNDAFYNKFGFNYHPHNDGNLYEECREFLSNNYVRINNYVDMKEIATNIEKHLKINGVKEQGITNHFINKAGL